ncbi:hypothetical protein SIO70_11660 [Chitinophaga sancti]|uniref:hypothetical protein n=1 Tax=Chitinophaga sancti TaxID=1004 RepID=UPI002A756200|nr:hypothetical protein [Chitinophaga sancti]WPQ65504.1 hypothetical protein SIO70_11660 [Chitinophaga sancti]
MKDKRYKAVKSLILANEIAKFSDIFEILPVSVLSKDTGINYSTLHRKIYNPKQLNLNDFDLMGKAMEIDYLELVKLAHKSLSKSK